MFDTLLIANRGAIACRILRSLREMNVRGVAVYSDADISSLHIQDADEAISLGEGAAAHTYLDSEKILSAALRSGAQAIHPGYGFLSENAAFAEACEAAQIAFVGPTPQQLRVFGLKHTARALAKNITCRCWKAPSCWKTAMLLCAQRQRSVIRSCSKARRAVAGLGCASAIALRNCPMRLTR